MVTVVTGEVLIGLIGSPLVDVAALVTTVKLVGLVNEEPLNLVGLAGNTYLNLQSMHRMERFGRKNYIKLEK